MRRITSGLMAAAVVASFAVASTAPAAARGMDHMMMMPQFGGGGGHFAGHSMQMHSGPSGHMAFADHRGGRNFDMRGGHAFFHDHHDFHRHFHDFDDDFVPGAFFAGTLFGSSYYGPTYSYVEPSYGNAHVQWCYNRYRSYRVYDNTFQPYNGPRLQCYSPYG